MTGESSDLRTLGETESPPGAEFRGRQRHQPQPEMCQSTKVIDGTEYRCERTFGHGGQHHSATAEPALIASWGHGE